MINVAERKRKKSKRKTGKRKKLFLMLFLEFVAVLMVIAVLYAVTKLDKLNIDTQLNEENLVINEEVNQLESLKGYRNIALFGVDISENNNLGKGARTDTIMVLSLNEDTKEAKLVSVYRDTYLDIGNQVFHKANAAYSKGGPEQAINMLNRNLDLNIKQYVTIDFRALTDTINALGGIEIEVMPEEIEHLNNYQIGTSEVTGGEIIPVTEPGLQTLNGLQATSYCRIRYTAGDDFKRTQRQRDVLMKVVEKAKKSDLGTINSIIDRVFGKIQTNIEQKEIMEYALSFSQYSIADTTGFPFEKTTGMMGKRGSCVIANNMAANVIQLHQFLFGEGEETYVPSSTVQEIGNRITMDAANYGITY